MELATLHVSNQPAVRAPDGSEVRALCALARGSMALFTLAPNAIARAVAHRSVEELWYFVAGAGRMWRRNGDDESIVAVGPGVSIAIPTGTRFQFRNEGPEPLIGVGTTMPPWPGPNEAYAVVGLWTPTM